MQKKAEEKIDSLREKFYEVSQFIGRHPELGNEEHHSSQKLTELLKEHGFEIEQPLPGQPATAFTAKKSSGKPGAQIGFMCEYDALPEIGHACGHNLIGTQSAAAAIGCAEALQDSGGTVYVYGTPAEETNGAKVTMAESGMFYHLDAALMAHPSSDYVKSGTSLAMDAIEFSFYGKTAHAAAAPEEGVNALDAVLQTFNGINALRQHVTEDVRIHGIIPEGGTAANVVPDYATARFYVRAETRKTVNPVTEKVKNCARAAALATGARLEIQNYEYSYDDMQTNEALSAVFTKQLHTLGIKPEEIFEEENGGGSLDMGNVSQRCPSIHPYVRITHLPLSPHTVEFRDAALSDEGFEGMMLGAKALAFTGIEIAANESVREKIKQEFLGQLSPAR
ncbi:M20 family metallopeptidase [Alkalicoccus halolimnae]|uniref:Peptidase M20 domain-containing protein 2 n=1 Tax=Alkalicoccus halolimnae TaxID=1667239 RepID=A0A5C7FBP3_9BACI|nr:M20 family metallopeptidase [Alkalicoccus halolimnae]TXF86868.1 M20 family metallopeptidase [Alkalicoccus halolimnae]